MHSELSIVKRFALKGAVRDNSIQVIASTVGNPDRDGDVIFPGAFAAVAQAFVADGFVTVGHDWDELPIAMPTLCEERGADLVCEAEFHSTPEAQAARTVCIERLRAGKKVSLSIGFLPDISEGVRLFGSGRELLDFAAHSGCDMRLFDRQALASYGPCRAILRIAELFEFSIVSVGMNSRARATSVKSAVSVLNRHSRLFQRRFEELSRRLDGLRS
jgi:phage head maturation protease